MVHIFYFQTNALEQTITPLSAWHFIPLVHMWNCGIWSHLMWIVADSEAKGVVKAKLSCFSVGSDSILQTAHTGLADKVTVWLMLQLWGFRNCLQQFATHRTERMLVYFNVLCWEGPGTAFWAVVSSAMMRWRWWVVVWAVLVNLSLLVRQTPEAIVSELVGVTSRVQTQGEKDWGKQPG